jgi:hypothetical protein
LLLALAVTLIGLAAAVRHATSLHEQVRRQAEAADLQQRLRAAADAMIRDMTTAGAGLVHGPDAGSLVRLAPAVFPSRRAGAGRDPSVFAAGDRITLLTLAHERLQTPVTRDVAGGGDVIEIGVWPSTPGCRRAPPCGFRPGMRTMLLGAGLTPDRYPLFDVFTTAATGATTLAAGNLLENQYRAGESWAAEVREVVYFHDRAGRRLVRVEDDGPAMPVADNIVSVAFSYYGESDPPLRPRSAPGEVSCLVDESGAPRLPSLPGGAGPAPLDLESLGDGVPSTCGAGASAYDPDLLRIRRIRASLRGRADVQAFGRTGVGQVPAEATITFEVAPRNLEPGK